MNIRKGSMTRSLFAGVGFAALLCGSAAAADAQADVTLGEIVVTAQKRGEKLIDVPVPVTAVDSQTLLKQNLVRVEDFGSRIPGLAVAGAALDQISIRGINTGSGTNPTIAVTVDDVPVVSATSISSVYPDIDPSELDRIEVLRGPQGTLYGAASLGGLIKMVTKDADPNEFSGRVELGYADVKGGASGTSERGALNVPLWKDKLGLRVSGFRRDDPRWIDNVNPLLNQDNVNKSRTQGGRVALFFRPVDQLTINLSHFQQSVADRDDDRTEVTGFPTDYKPVRGYFVTNTAPTSNLTKLRVNEARVNYDFGPVALTSVSGWSKFSNFADRDLTTTFPFVLGAITPDAPDGSAVRLKDGNGVKKFTQEVRLASQGDTKLQWLVGAFYTDEDITTDQNLQVFTPSGSLFSDVVDFPNPATYKEKAVFADVTYKFTDQFDLQVGGRYSKNKQTYRQNTISTDAAADFFGPTAVGDVQRSSDHAFTWLVTPRYKINKDMMVYARIASGYRPGGPNISVPGAPASYDSDSVVNYELGFKGFAFDRTVTIDASIFDIEWKDIQLLNTSANNLTYIDNGGKARSRGVEVAGQWAPGGGWVVSANATYTNAELTEAIDVPAGGSGVIGEKGTELPYTPKFASNLGIEKSFDLPRDLRLTLGGNWSHIGKRNSLLRSTLAPVERQGALKMPAYNVVDLRADLTDGKWDLSVYVRNLANGKGVLYIDDRQGAVTTTNANFINPRTVGVLVARNF
jgi:outer membrane receptor protein involved in Fe transport